MAQPNQPRNRYGLKVDRQGKPPATFWYPSPAARDDAWRGFAQQTDVTGMEATGAGAQPTT